MPYDAQATRERLLAAATDEFASRGLAGGRVDRIAAAADANKRAIYDYFGGKEGLFQAVVARVVGDLNAANPLLEDDLPTYAGRLFDYLHQHPDAVRMVTWWRLERPELVAGLGPDWLERLRAVGDPAGALSGDRPVTRIGATDLIILVIGLVNAWFLSAAELLQGAGEDPSDPARLAAHREAVVAAVRRLSADRDG